MKIKIFKIRMQEQFRDADEAFLNDFLEAVKVVEIKPSLIYSPTESFWSVFVTYEELDEAQLEHERVLFDSSEPLTPEEEELYVRLRSWREIKARKQGLPPYLILHDAHIKTIIKLRPDSLAQFRQIKGLSQKKITQYGDEILTLLQDSAS